MQTEPISKITNEKKDKALYLLTTKIMDMLLFLKCIHNNIGYNKIMRKKSCFS